jgi:hypothetical protein
MNTMSLTQWILAATLVVAAVLVPIVLAHLVRNDGYGSKPAPDPRSDWGTRTLPSSPYASRF